MILSVRKALIIAVLAAAVSQGAAKKTRNLRGEAKERTLKGGDKKAKAKGGGGGSDDYATGADRTTDTSGPCSYGTYDPSKVGALPNFAGCDDNSAALGGEGGESREADEKKKDDKKKEDAKKNDDKKKEDADKKKDDKKKNDKKKLTTPLVGGNFDKTPAISTPGMEGYIPQVYGVKDGQLNSGTLIGTPPNFVSSTTPKPPVVINNPSANTQPPATTTTQVDTPAMPQVDPPAMVETPAMPQVETMPASPTTEGQDGQVAEPEATETPAASQPPQVMVNNNRGQLCQNGKCYSEWYGREVDCNENNYRVCSGSP